MGIKMPTMEPVNHEVEFDDLEIGEIAMELDHQGPWDVIEWAYETFGNRVGIVTALQVDGMVTLDMAYDIAPDDVRVITVESSGGTADAEGNASAAASQTFASTPNIGGLTGKGAVVFAVNVGPTTNTTANLDGDDDNTYGGAITNDPIIGVDLQADNPAWYAPSSKTGNNIDGIAGDTGSNPDLDGSALHTYRDSANNAMTATYPVPNGIYVVELWFAELFWDSAGNRQGDYTINGEVLATDFDAFTAAGGADTPTVLTKTVVVTDGELVVDVSDDAGQPGWNAVVVYEALAADTPPTVSVEDVTAVEGGAAEVVFTRTGDTTEEVTVTFTVTPNAPATAADYDDPTSLTATIPAGAVSSAPVTIPIVDDSEEEGAESLTVEITALTNTSGDATGVGATGTVTIAPSDSALQIPSGGTILELDFETPGDPLGAGGGGDRHASVPARHRPVVAGYGLWRGARADGRTEDRRLVHGRQDRDRSDDHPHDAARRDKHRLRPDARGQVDPVRRCLLGRSGRKAAGGGRPPGCQ